MSDRIQPGSRVSLHYRLSSYGQDIADTFPDAPEVFRVGTGEVDARLEQHLLGLVAGERHLFQLHPWQAFGERDETLIQSLPRADFPAESDLTPGHQVEFDLPNGETWLGTVLDADADQVRIDFNHPLAGLPVEFDVQILTVDNHA